VKNVDGGLQAGPVVKVEVAEDEAALWRSLEDVQAPADLDDPTGA